MFNKEPKEPKNSFLSVPGTTVLPSAEFPCRAILCITLSLLSGFQSLACIAVLSSLGFTAPPAFADPLDAMKAREFLQKGNVHLTRLEFQQALDAYTECLLCDPNNRTAKDNIVLTHNNWGIYWFQKRKYKEAREEWEQALKLNPSDRNARTNLQVLRITLSRQGVSEEGEKKPPPAKANSDFPPSQVIILTPGLKSGGGSQTGSAATSNSGSSQAGGADTGSSNAPEGATASGATLLGGSSGGGSADSGSGAAVIIKSGNAAATTSGGGNDSSSGVSSYTNGSGANAYSTGVSPQAGGSSGGAASQTGTGSTPSGGYSGANYSENGAGKFTTAPASTQANTSAAGSSATAGGSQGENIEDSLGQIEQKIYGRKQDSLPIMKRLEKLETDTHGKTKSGTIKERIDTLRKSYGF